MRQILGIIVGALGPSLGNGSFCKLRTASNPGINVFETGRIFFFSENKHLNNDLSKSLKKILKKRPSKVDCIKQ